MSESKNFREKNDKRQILMSKVHKLLSDYFHINIPDEKEATVIKQFLFNYKNPEDTFLARTSRMFNFYANSDRKRAMTFLQTLDSCNEYFDFINAIYNFVLSDVHNGIPQGKLRQDLLNLLIKEFAISNNFYEEACRNRNRNIVKVPPIIGIGNTMGSTIIPTPTLPQESLESQIWRRKSEAVQAAVNNLKVEAQRVSITRDVLLEHTHLPTELIALTTSYLKPN